MTVSKILRSSLFIYSKMYLIIIEKIYSVTIFKKILILWKINDYLFNFNLSS